MLPAQDPRREAHAPDEPDAPRESRAEDASGTRDGDAGTGDEPAREVSRVRRRRDGGLRVESPRASLHDRDHPPRRGRRRGGRDPRRSATSSLRMSSAMLLYDIYNT